MWLPNSVVSAVDAVARINYLSRHDTKAWNERRPKDELRMMCGWYWVARDGSGIYGQGLKTRTIAYRQAWYVLVANATAPLVEIRRGRNR